jgi:hypothetical protein
MSYLSMLTCTLPSPAVAERERRHAQARADLGGRLVQRRDFAARHGNVLGAVVGDSCFIASIMARRISHNLSRVGRSEATEHIARAMIQAELPHHI